MRHHLPALLLFPLLCIACSHSAPATVPMAFTACKVSDVGPVVDSSWHQVRASGFTFCVPGSWSPSRPSSDSLDPRAWKGKDGSVTWDVGRPPALRRTTQTATGTMTAVTVTPGGRTMESGPPSFPGPHISGEVCSPPAPDVLMVDSVSLLVAQVHCEKSWTTTGWSAERAIYVLGEAHSIDAAKTLNAIMVTIRFASSRP